MKKFMVIYHTPSDLTARMAEVSPEEQAKGMEGWMTWAQQCGDKLIDLGTPLMNGQMLSPDGGSAGSRRDVAGYSILQAESMEEAKSLLMGHPHLAWDASCSIEVHEAMPLPGM